MAYVPLIWFGIIFIFIYIRRGFDVSAFTTLMFVITSLFSVIALNLKIVDPERVNPSLLSTLIYCILSSLTLLPVYKFDSKRISNIKVVSSRSLDILTYFFFISLLFSIAFYWDDILFRLAFGDWDQLRQLLYSGNGYSIKQLPGSLHFISLAMNIFGTISYIMITVFFISLIYLKKNKWYLIMAILGSTLSMINAVLFIERARVFIWMIMLGLNFVIFWPLMSSKNKRFIMPIIAVIVSGLFAYSISITVSRFGSKSDDGTRNSIVKYFGQPYINFCYFYDNFDNKEGFSTKALFPITHTLIIKDYVGGVDRQQELTKRTGIDCGVFYSFLGTFILDGNQVGPFVFVLLFLLLSMRLIKRRAGNSIDLPNLFLALGIIIVPSYGCIAYIYAHWYPLFATLCLLIFLHMSNKTKYIER